MLAVVIAGQAEGHVVVGVEQETQPGALASDIVVPLAGRDALDEAFAGMVVDRQARREDAVVQRPGDRAGILLVAQVADREFGSP